MEHCIEYGAAQHQRCKLPLSLWEGWLTHTNPFSVMRSPEDISCFFADSDKHTKAMNNNSGWLMGTLLGRCLGLISGKPYQKLKEATAPRFTHKIATSYLPQIERITKDYMQELSEELPKKKHLMDPVQDLKYLPFWILVAILYGDINPQMKIKLKGLAVLREKLWARMIQGGAPRFSIFRFLPAQITKELMEFKQEWRSLNRSAYEACVLADEGAAIMDMYAEVKRGVVDEEEMLQTLDEMLFANLDVTMGGLSWNLLFLAKHQEYQDGIRHEFRITTSRNGYLGSSSTLLAHAILESSRLKPLAAFTVAQSAPTTRVIQGFHIPANTNCIIDTHALNIKNPFWGVDSEFYRPSRFEGIKNQDMRYQFWRFGFGPRQCLGKYVVDLILRSVLLCLIENHRLSLTETTHWDKNPTTWILHPETEIICEPLTENVYKM